jgi:hypothetical protein
MSERDWEILRLAVETLRLSVPPAFICIVEQREAEPVSRIFQNRDF